MTLETSAVLALLQKEAERDEFVSLIEKAPRRLISAVSVLEAAMVLEGRMGIASLEIDDESALHADPSDRMLVAQAIVQGMTIPTPDPQIEKYAVRVLW